MKKIRCQRRFKYVCLHLVRIIDSLTVVFSLGFIESGLYPDLLFSDWAEDIDKRN